MKKLLLSVVMVFIVYLASAQVDSLQEYTGKYKFPAGGPVSLITITIQDGSLYASSDIGNSTMTRNEGDVFTVDAYGAIATFQRNTDKKVTGIKIEAESTVMEGTKEPASTNLVHVNRVFNRDAALLKQ